VPAAELRKRHGALAEAFEGQKVELAMLRK
jgi:hypothetical protein